jgi:hypothetical protein
LEEEQFRRMSVAVITPAPGPKRLKHSAHSAHSAAPLDARAARAGLLRECYECASRRARGAARAIGSGSSSPVPRWPRPALKSTDVEGGPTPTMTLRWGEVTPASRGSLVNFSTTSPTSRTSWPTRMPATSTPHLPPTRPHSARLTRWRSAAFGLPLPREHVLPVRPLTGPFPRAGCTDMANSC